MLLPLQIQFHYKFCIELSSLHHFSLDHHSLQSFRATPLTFLTFSLTLTWQSWQLDMVTINFPDPHLDHRSSRNDRLLSGALVRLLAQYLGPGREAPWWEEIQKFQEIRNKFNPLVTRDFMIFCDFAIMQQLFFFYVVHVFLYVPIDVWRCFSSLMSPFC